MFFFSSTYSTLYFTLVLMSHLTNAIREVSCLWNPEFWAFDSGIYLLDSGT